MPFRRVRVKKELEIVSLIDVVFMLIIFGLVVSVAGGITKFPGPPLPKTFSITISRAPSVDDQPGVTSADRLMVAFFNSEGNQVADTANFPIDDSLSTDTLSVAGFDDLKPCRLIREQIEAFADEVRGFESDGEGERAVIHVEVTRDTKARVVNYISRQCADFQRNIGWVRLVAK